MKPSFPQLIPLKPLTARAKPTVAPTILWVADTGNRSTVAPINQQHDPDEKHDDNDKFGAEQHCNTVEVVIIWCALEQQQHACMYVFYGISMKIKMTIAE